MQRLERQINAAPGTVDPAELDRYNKLAATWWDAGGPMWPLHRLNAIRVPFITRCVATAVAGASEDDLRGLTVLDIGCGAGLLAEAMARRGARVTGGDPAERIIAIARDHAANMGLDIDYRTGTVEELPPGHWDIVLNMEVVEHVEQLDRFMAHCCERVAPGGMHFLATINRNLASFAAAIVGAEYVLRWLPRGTHQWHKFVRPGEAEAMLAASGMTVVERSGVAVNPLNRHYSLTRSERINYMLMARRT